MKAPNEIKLALEICAVDSCRGCPYEADYDCYNKNKDALAYIQQLERERDEAWKVVDGLNTQIEGMVEVLESMKRKYSKACKERDAAVEDMTELMQLAQFCRHCKHLTDDGECTFDFVANKGEPWCWQWRGVEVE